MDLCKGFHGRSAKTFTVAFPCPGCLDRFRRHRGTVSGTLNCRICASAVGNFSLRQIPDKDEAGRFVDFHCLRVSLSTLLAANKVSPRAAQALMRHTDPRLTAGVYTDEKLLPLAAELVGVPAIPTQQISSIPKADDQEQSILAGLLALS